jgi:hypothetical protein
MASSGLGAELDIEAQKSGATVPPPIELEDDPPTNTANPQPLSSADPQLQAINTNEHPSGNRPAPQIANNSEVKRGMLTLPISRPVISFVY